MQKHTKILIDNDAVLSIQESINIGKRVFQRKLMAYQTKIAKLEELNNMDTVTFSQLFNKGELGDKKEWLKWDHYASVINLLEKKLSDIEGIRYES